MLKVYIARGCIIMIIQLTYSWSEIVLGKPILEVDRNNVLRWISWTSAFLRSLSPSFSPEVRWQHTKQKSVSYMDMLTDIDPWAFSQIVN